MSEQEHIFIGLIAILIFDPFVNSLFIFSFPFLSFLADIYPS